MIGIKQNHYKEKGFQNKEFGMNFVNLHVEILRNSLIKVGLRPKINLSLFVGHRGLENLEPFERWKFSY